MKPKAKVSITKSKDRYKLVKETLELFNIENQLKKKTKILIKPNLVKVPSESPYAKMQGAYETTFTKGDIIQRETLEALLKVLTEKGAQNITIGEGAGGSETTLIYEALNLQDLADEYKAQLVDLNFAEATKIPIQDKMLLDHLWVPKIVLESDLKISLAAMKTIEATCITLCLKNWGMGIPPAKYYGLNKAQAEFYKGLENPLPIHKSKGKKINAQEVGVSQEIVDVCTTVPYNLGIIDGTLVQDYSTPGKDYFSPQRCEIKDLMIASQDIVAVDAVGTRVLGFNPDKIVHIQWAAQKGLGTSNLSDIEICGRRIEDVEMRTNAMESQIDLMLPPLR